MNKFIKFMCLLFALSFIPGCSTKPTQSEIAAKKELAKKQYVLDNTLLIGNDFFTIDKALDIKPLVANLGTVNIVFDVIDARAYNFVRTNEEANIKVTEDHLYETILELNGKRLNINNKTLYTYAKPAKQLNMLCLVDMDTYTLLGFDGVEIATQREDILIVEKTLNKEISKSVDKNVDEVFEELY